MNVSVNVSVNKGEKQEGKDLWISQCTCMYVYL